MLEDVDGNSLSKLGTHWAAYEPLQADILVASVPLLSGHPDVPSYQNRKNQHLKIKIHNPGSGNEIIYGIQAREYIWKISIYLMQTSQASRRLGAQSTKVHDQLQVDNTNFYSNWRVVHILGDLESSSKFEKISWWVSGFSELSTPASISEIITPIIKDTLKQ